MLHANWFSGVVGDMRNSYRCVNLVIDSQTITGRKGDKLRLLKR